MNDAPGLGHNQPPLIARTLDLIATCNRWVTERPTLTDEEMAGIAQDHQNQLRLCRTQLEAELKERRKPIDEALAAVKAEYRDPLEMLSIALTKMGGLLTPWLQAKDERLKAEAAQRERDAEDARRRAELAADRAATSGTVEDELEARRAITAADEAADDAGKPVHAQVKGDFSPRASSLRTTWSAVIEDEKLALRAFSKNPEVRTAALVAVKRICDKRAREAKSADAAPPGVRFVSRQVVV